MRAITLLHCCVFCGWLFFFCFVTFWACCHTPGVFMYNVYTKRGLESGAWIECWICWHAGDILPGGGSSSHIQSSQSSVYGTDKQVRAFPQKFPDCLERVTTNSQHGATNSVKPNNKPTHFSCYRMHRRVQRAHCFCTSPVNETSAAVKIS